MKTNKKIKTVSVYTAEGAPAARINPELQLRRFCELENQIDDRHGY